MKSYSLGEVKKPGRRKGVLLGVGGLVLLLLIGFGLYVLFADSPEERAERQLQFDQSLTVAEQQTITEAIADAEIEISGTVSVSVQTATTAESAVLAAYVPVTHQYAVRQDVTVAELSSLRISVPADTDAIIKAALAGALNLDESAIGNAPETLDDQTVVFLPVDQLSTEVKLLSLDGTYYLDSFVSGAVFRSAVYEGDDTEALGDVALNTLASKDTTLKVNASGVTALTRLMMRKLPSVGPTYFSEKIGTFMADADITHVSNEVSFLDGCQYSNTSFCSPPEFIETLKSSGVDLVEITGNHNNDKGSTPNAETINLYRSLGWNVFGGGLNSDEAAKPYLADQKGSKVAFLGYNMADGLGSGAIAGDASAGANFYTDEKAQAAIAAAKESAQFVIVHIQYAECQAYPSGYVEYPVCDSPIAGQEEDFKKLIDFGADMVVGSSAHQPQTFEFYNGKPIYYGLGNMYFEQTQWPGTERGIILTHYFVGGKLLQTKLTPTVYDRDYQTRVMTADEAAYLLGRLDAARN